MRVWNKIIKCKLVELVLTITSKIVYFSYLRLDSKVFSRNFLLKVTKIASVFESPAIPLQKIIQKYTKAIFYYF